MRNYIRTLSILLSFLSPDRRSATFAQVPDPGTPGPLAVTREEYDFGDTAFQPYRLSWTG